MPTRVRYQQWTMQPLSGSASGLSRRLFGGRIVGGMVTYRDGLLRQVDGSAPTFQSGSRVRQGYASFGAFCLRQDGVSGPNQHVGFSLDSVSPQNFSFLTRMRLAASFNRNSVAVSFDGGADFQLFPNGTAWDMRLGGTNHTEAGSWDSDRWYDVAVVGSPSSTILYVDNQIVIAGSAPATATEISGGISFQDSGASDDVSFQFAYVVAAPLSGPQVERVFTNPWQLFAPRRLLVPVAAGGGIPTLSAATVFAITANSAQPRVTVTF